MSDNAPLTIENFNFEKLRAKPFEWKRSGVFTYFAIPFAYDGKDPLMKIEGNFRVFKHVNAGRVNYCLAISINDENEKFFSELGHRIATLACENKGKTPKLKPSDLELIKTTANGKYKNVYARIYMKSSGMVNCKIPERKEVKGVFKRSKLRINDLVDESFKESCVLKVYRMYVGSSKRSRFPLKRLWLPNSPSKSHTLMNMRVATSHRQRKIKVSLIVTFYLQLRYIVRFSQRQIVNIHLTFAVLYEFRLVQLLSCRSKR